MSRLLPFLLGLFVGLLAVRGGLVLARSWFAG
jgi:hypothetical protein